MGGGGGRARAPGRGRRGRGGVAARVVLGGGPGAAVPRAHAARRARPLPAGAAALAGPRTEHGCSSVAACRSLVAGIANAKCMWSAHMPSIMHVMERTSGVAALTRRAFMAWSWHGTHDKSPQAPAHAARRARCRLSSWRSSWQPRENRPSPRPSARRASDTYSLVLCAVVMCGSRY